MRKPCLPTALAVLCCCLEGRIYIQSPEFCHSEDAVGLVLVECGLSADLPLEGFAHLPVGLQVRTIQRQFRTDLKGRKKTCSVPSRYMLLL